MFSLRMKLETGTAFLSSGHLLIGLPDSTPDKILFAVLIIEPSLPALEVLSTLPLTGL